MAATTALGQDDVLPTHEAQALADAGAAGTIEVLKCSDLNVDPMYQRDLSRELVERIKSRWDTAGAGYIVVSRRKNGALYIINGQHRVAARMELAMEAGDETGGEIVSQVFTGLTPQQEAELRLIGNTKRTDTSQERFRAQVAAGHKESLEIQEILRQFGTRVNPAPDQKHGINAVSAVESIYRTDGGLLLSSVMEVVKDAFGEIGGPYASVNMFKSLAWMLTRHKSELDKQRLIDQLSREGIDSIDRKARNHKAAAGGAGWMNYYRATVEVYNHRLGASQRLEVKTGGWSKAAFGTRSDSSSLPNHE